MENFYWLIQGDAFKVLPELGMQKIDLIILDPPYLVTELPRVKKKATEALKRFSDSDWINLFRILYIILKDNRDLVIFGHFSSFMKIHRFIEVNNFKFVTDLVWVKPNVVNFLMAKQKPLSQHEMITVWCKKRFRYNFKDALSEGDPYIKRNTAKEWYLYDIIKPQIQINKGYRYMSDVLFAPNKPTMSFDERTVHPTQKPETLISQLVRAFSFEGDIVLDPFLGSGTTMKVCQDLKRSCIGIEINPGYCEIAKKRCFGRKFLDRKVEYRFDIWE